MAVRRWCAGMLALAALLVLPAAAPAAVTLQEGFHETVALGGLTHPTAVRFAPDGRIFVAEKAGRIKVFDGFGDPTPEVYADLSARVYDFWDRGLLGLALDPRSATGSAVYVLYTYDKDPRSSQVPRWGDTCSDPTGNGCVVTGRLSRLDAHGQEEVLIEDWCQQYPSHTVGSLAFGADGALYVSGGDGASYNWPDHGQGGSPPNPCGDPAFEGGALRSQDVRTTGDPTGLDGAILRVDPDTGAPLPDNPGTGDENARRIVAYGLRNPFRIAVRPGTSEVWAADVGWSTWEEIDRIASPTAGLPNFGWPCYEGGARQLRYDDLDLALCETLSAQTGPYFAYRRGASPVPGDGCTTGGSSISGLAFAPPDSSLPPRYDGALFFSDYSRDCVWVMLRGPDGLPDPGKVETFAVGASNPVELQFGPNGDLYYVDLDFSGYGAIRRIRFNSAPVARATADPPAGEVLPFTVRFDGSGSSDREGSALDYAWDFDGDGSFDDSSDPRPEFEYRSRGLHVAWLQVTDAEGRSDTTSVTITAGKRPAVAIHAPSSGTTWKVSDTVAFSGSATAEAGDPIPASGLAWTLTLEHCEPVTGTCHTHPLQSFAGAGGSFRAPDHEFPSHLELRLTACDEDGLCASATRRLDPRTVSLTLASSPAGLQLAFGGEVAAAPFTRRVIAGSSNSVGAASPQNLGGVPYTFSGWSDAGARHHTSVAAADATLTATFKPPPDDDDGGSTAFPPPRGPVGAWGFDEPRGRGARDASGAGNRGRLSGPTRTRGRFGGGLAFDGRGDWVTVPDADSLDLDRALTLEAWVRPASRRGWRSVLVKERGRRLSYALYARPSGHVFTTAEQALRGSPALPVRRWSHLAMTWDGLAARIYVDGREISSGALAGTARRSRGPLRIGGNGIWPEFFKGVIDEVRIYDRALTAREIARDRRTAITPGARRPRARKAQAGGRTRRTRRAVHRGTRWLSAGGGAPRSG